MVPLRVLRFVNPLVRIVLRSRAHRVLSGRLLLLTYRGRRSARTFEIPLRYRELGDGRLVVVALRPARKLWWRSVREPAQVTVVVRGTRVAATAELVEAGARNEAATAYAAGSERLSQLVRDAAVVVVMPTG